MKRAILLFLTCVLGLASGVAQQPADTHGATVPSLVKFSGSALELGGKPLSGTLGVTFAIYKDQSAGSPLWLETQSVLIDKTGHYTVSLGITKAGGLPADIFKSGDAKWLGVQIEGQSEQPRVLLLSVPYALKAGDAETIGGLPPSAFVLAGTGNGTSLTSDKSSVNSPLASTAPPASSNVTTTGGTTNALPLWTTATNIQSSLITQSGSGATGRIGIGTGTPASTLDVKGGTTVRGFLQLPSIGNASATAGTKSQAFDLQAAAFNSSSAASVAQVFQWQAEPVGNNTPTPSATLNLQFGSGPFKPAETGLKISSSGVFTFAAGQTFPGTGTLTGITTAIGSGLSGGGTTGNLTIGLLKTCSTSQTLQWNGTAWVCSSSGTGTITGVTAGTDLVGGGTSGNVTLNLNTAALQTANDARYVQLGSANVFTQPQTINTTAGTGLTVTSSLATARALYGHATNTGSGPAYGILGGAEGVDGVGVWGYSNGNAGYGLQGKGAANGVLGWPVINSSIWNSYSSVGVHGDNGATNGIGVLGTVDNGSAVLGVNTGGGTGVYGVGVGGMGVEGVGSTAGVYGSTTATGGSANGVQGASTNATAVRGDDAGAGSGVVGTSINGFAVYGSSHGSSGLPTIPAAIEGDSNTSAGVWGNSSTNDGVHGINNTGAAGVSGVNNSGGFGVYGETKGTALSFGGANVGVIGVAHSQNAVGIKAVNDAQGGFGFGTPNDVGQGRSAGGWVKAMVFVDPFTANGTAITRCFNSQASGATVSTPPCGFGISHVTQGQDLIDYGFQVNDRYLSATSFAGVVLSACVLDSDNLCLTFGFNPFQPNANQVLVTTKDTSNNLTDGAFWVIVF